jgi:hypothetical protein
MARGVQMCTERQKVTLSPWDSVVLADTFQPLREAANLLKPRRLKAHFIGDARRPRHLMYAIGEGEELGRTI